MLRYIEQAFERIFTTFQVTDLSTCSTPIKLLQNFYMDHQSLIPMTIGNISIPLTKFIYLRGISNKDEKIRDELTKSGIRFLACVASHFDMLVEKVGYAIALADESDLFTFCGVIKFLKECLTNPEIDTAKLNVEVKLLEGLTSFLVRIQVADIIDYWLEEDYAKIKLVITVVQNYTETLDYLYSPNATWTREELGAEIAKIPAITKYLQQYEQQFIDLCHILSTFKVRFL